MATKKNNAIQTPAAAALAAYPILAPATQQDALDTIGENLGEAGVQLSNLDRVTVPPGGGKAFALPSLDTETYQPTLTGIIVYAPRMNAYWARPMEDAPNDPPACFSQDTITGTGDPSNTGAQTQQPCATCPNKAWGSSPKGRGKACRDLRPIFLLMPGEYLPTIISTPRMSLKRLSTYFTRLAKAGLPYYSVVTEIGLAQESRPGTPEYSYLTFAMKEAIPKDARPSIKSLQAILAAVASAPTVAATAAPPAEPESYNPFAEDDQQD